MNHFGVSASAGALGAFMSHPFDVVKTSMQRANGTHRMSTIGYLKHYATHQPMILWTGVVPRCAQVMLSMGIGSVVFYRLLGV